MLYAHAVRSYVFAALLAHDIGLTPDYEQPVAPFEQVSADIAVGLSARFGWPSERRETLADAIVLHIAAEVGADESPEARALEAGVAVDCGPPAGRHRSASRCRGVAPATARTVQA
jgi:hypothetical protein